MYHGLMILLHTGDAICYVSCSIKQVTDYYTQQEEINPFAGSGGI